MLAIRAIRRQPDTIEERLDDLERSGALARPSGPRKPLRAVAQRPGALERFLADRDE